MAKLEKGLRLLNQSPIHTTGDEITILYILLMCNQDSGATGRTVLLFSPESFHLWPLPNRAPEAPKCSETLRRGQHRAPMQDITQCLPRTADRSVSREDLLLRQLHGDHGTYRKRSGQATQHSVRERYLLPEDAQRLLPPERREDS